MTGSLPPTGLPDYTGKPPIETGTQPDGKSLINPEREGKDKSSFYDSVWSGEADSKFWDFHVYHLPNNKDHAAYARKLHEAVRREFPELRVYNLRDKPVGPHPVPMFEVNVFNPHQLGSLLSYFVANRGPCSVLIHPNTTDLVADHTTHATWLGERFVLDVDMLKAVQRRKQEQQAD